MRSFFRGLSARIQGAAAVTILILVGLAYAGATNYDRLVLGDANYGSDPHSANSYDIALENDEAIDNQTDDMITLRGSGGADDTDFRVDLDGTRPVLSSPTDAEVGLDGGLILTPTDTAPTAAEGMLYWDDSENILKTHNGTDWVNIGAGSGDNTLDNAYDQGGAGLGKKINADSGAVEIEVADGSNNVALHIDHDEATNDDTAVLIENAADAANAISIDIDAQATGRDIEGTGATWFVTGAGALTIASGTNNGTLTQTGVLTTSGDVDMDATGGSAADPDLSIDGFTLHSGATEFAANITMDDGSGAAPTISIIDGSDQNVVISKADGAAMLMTASVAGDGVSVRTGNFWVGDAAASTAAMDGEDAFVEGEFEVDGAVQFDGAVTAASTLAVTGGALTLQNSESINTGTDATFDFTRNDSGTVTITASDDDAIAAVIYDAGGASAITIGSADVTNVTVNSDVGLTFANNSDSINNLADATFDLTRNDTGIVTVTCSDDDATAGCTYDAGGAAPIVIGSADVTNVTINSDVGLTFANNSDSLNNLADATFDFTRNDTGAVTLTCSDDDATCAMVYDAGGAAAITIGSADVTAVNLDSDTGLVFSENSESIINSADGTFDLTRNDAGVVSVICSDDDATAGCTYDAGGAAPIVIGSADVTNVTVDSDVGLTFAENSESINNLADAIFDFTRNDAGAVTLTCSDDDAACAMVYDAGGASAITVGSADVTAVTVTTDGAGDAEVVLPENSLGPDELAAMVEPVLFCGQNANSGTIYGGPVTAFLGGDYTTSYAIGTAGCDALDNATEGAAAAPLGFANTGLKVLGMHCEVDTSGSNGVTLTLRSAEADLTPSVTCTIATGSTTCTSTTASTTDIAANATMAVKSVTTEDLSTNDFWCKVYVSWK